MRLKLLGIITLAFIIGALTAFLLLPKGGDIESAKQVRNQGKPLIGGGFSLLNHRDKRVTEKDFSGKYMLVTFGYTSCPDVCPTSLQVIAEALDLLGEKADQIAPLFITIDPERDTVAELSSYVSHFHNKLIGLTGTPKEIKTVAKAYRIYYAKGNKNKTEEDYIMDHTSLIYLMGKEGEYISHFPYGINALKMAKRLKQKML